MELKNRKYFSEVLKSSKELSRKKLDKQLTHMK